MTDDDDLKLVLIDRLATGPRTDRGIADMMAKWSLADLEAMVEVIGPRHPTPQGRRDGEAPLGL